MLKGHVFMRSYQVSDHETYTRQQPQNQVLVLNAKRKNAAPSRFVDSVQKTFTISYEPTDAADILPKFEQPVHSFPLLNTIPAKSVVLGKLN